MEDDWKRGVRLGAGVGLVAGIEVCVAHRLLDGTLACFPRLLPAAAVLVLAGAAAGLAGGWFGSRFFRLLRSSASNGAAFYGILAAGYLLWPRGLEAACAGAVLLARLFRRRFLPRRSRLDAFFVLGAFTASAFFLVDHLPPALPEPAPSSADSAGTPVPGSIPVTITIHQGAGFPEVPAVHPSLRALDADSLSACMALWSGIAPDRSAIGKEGARRLPGGGILAWIPARPVPSWILSRIGRPLPADEPVARDRPLERIVEGANIPILRSLPSENDPPLWFRVIESEDSVTREEAERLSSAGAWIDVRLDPRDPDIAFAGEGIRLAPAGAPASWLDVAPTVLHLLGLAVPRDSDGRVLLELIDPAGPAGRSPRYRSRTGRPSRSSSIASK